MTEAEFWQWVHEHPEEARPLLAAAAKKVYSEPPRKDHIPTGNALLKLLKRKTK